MKYWWEWIKVSAIMETAAEHPKKGVETMVKQLLSNISVDEKSAGKQEKVIDGITVQ